MYRIISSVSLHFYSPQTLVTCNLAYCRIELELHLQLEQWEQKQYLSHVDNKCCGLNCFRLLGSWQADFRHTTPQKHSYKAIQCSHTTVGARMWVFNSLMICLPVTTEHIFRWRHSSRSHTIRYVFIDTHMHLRNFYSGIGNGTAWMM